MFRTLRLVLCAVLIIPSGPIHAAETVTFAATLSYDGKRVTLSAELFRPNGEGPFPAVVLMHGCGGLPAPARHSLRTHAQHLGANGFAALILDSFGPRENSDGWVCQTYERLDDARDYRVADALDAAQFLKGQSYIDAGNIFQMGQSNGGSVAIRLAQNPDSAFRAVAAYYPWCGAFRSKNGHVRLTRPLIVFSGALDDWTPPGACKGARTVGAEYKATVYSGAAHSFDLNIELQRYLGYLVGYNHEATLKSRNEMVVFFNRYLSDALKARSPQSAQATTPARKYLTGGEIKALLTDGKLTGVNAYGNPYTISYAADGGMSGVAGKSNEYKDTGKWWIKGDMFCRQYKTWLDGKAACFNAVLNGKAISWFDAGGNLVSSDTLLR